MSCHTLGGPGTLPVLRDDLYRIPWTAKRGRVTQVEIVDAVYGHAVEERRGVDVDALGDLGPPRADDLRTEELSRVSIASDAQAQALGTRVVGLVVPRLGLHGEWIETGLARLLIREPRPRNGQLKHLDHLGADRALKHALSADGILAGHPPC